MLFRSIRASFLSPQVNKPKFFGFKFTGQGTENDVVALTDAEIVKPNTGANIYKPCTYTTGGSTYTIGSDSYVPVTGWGTNDPGDCFFLRAA